MIRTIIFDIGNVMMRFDYEPYVKELVEDPVTADKVIRALWKSGLWDQLDLGVDPEEVFSRVVDTEPSCEKEIRLALEHVDQCMGRMDYAKPWVRELKDRGYQVLYLSNYSEYMMGRKPEALDFVPLTDGGVFSCYVHLVKPNPEIYQVLCDKYDLIPEECAFIDDNMNNIITAREFGLNAIHFKSYEQAKKELDQMLEK